jgi:hypothetical protein
MTDRQFFWGLSNGAVMFTLAGFFWFGIAMSAIPRAQPLFVLLVGAFVLLLLGVTRLRRKARGFRYAELALAGERQRHENRRIQLGIRWAVIAQTVLIGGGVYGFVSVGRQDLIWAWIGLIVSLHFLPLGRVFQVPAYYVTGLAGAAASLAALAGLIGSPPLAILGLTMGAIMWSTTIYLLQGAERIVARGIEAIEKVSTT